ncbi:Tad domain-containing protein [Sulfitobacter sp. F26169L]|uniref:Tad domain-containing protein n=1 Tax=Sulfitobacter sp. F26169L TaxID=2996015 RepID=UPI002260FE7C|nr:Tad domain-containing protein [Sulfitobacter sp. F26169L]MCX7568007.1 Tad domain-containing protein [Sulfitobacter sp. F26169L]
MTQNEDGSMTLLAVFFVLIAIVMGGLAIDFNKVIAERNQLQIATDTAAHTALYSRMENDVASSQDQALTIVSSMLPESVYGAVALSTADIVFGNWDADTAEFTADINSKNAVWVQAEMSKIRGNPSRNFLLRLIGYDTFDVGVETVYTTYYPPCFTEGFVAEEVVDIQSNNSFTDGFCIHSNEYVSLNQNNYFEPGTVVSMPDLADLDIPKSGFEKNEGLQTALRGGAYRLRLLNDLPDIINSFWSGEAEHLPPYVYSGTPYSVSSSTLAVPDPDGNNSYKGQGLTPQHFEPNSVNRFNCSGSGKITLQAGTYSNFVLVTDCQIKFANGVVLADVVVATTNTSATSFNTPSGLSIGRDDNCAPGGGATLMTLGGFNAASSLNVFGGQILAIGDIEFAANADGIEGVSFVSYGMIDGTSNMNMGFCQNRGMENAYRAEYFRTVK